MSFFKRLFGGEQPGSEPEGGEAPPQRLAEDPYRGSLVSELPAEPTRKATKIKPIWDSWSELLAIERGDGSGFPIRSLTYTGEGSGLYAVRKVTFVDDGVAVDWEQVLAERGFLSDHLTVRVDDRILIPRATGLVAVHVETGEACWELPHPAKLYKTPRRTAGGDLLLVFSDQSWIEVAARDGAFRSEGRVRSDAEVDQLLENARELMPPSDDETWYGGHKVDIQSTALRVRKEQPKVRRDRYEPPPPAVGMYPIDEWTPDDYVDLVHDKLAVRLGRTWGNKTRMAVGLFEPTSLEPLRLLELGDFESSDDFKSAHIVDDLLVFYTDDLLVGTETPYATFVIDTRAETVLSCFIADHPSHLFDASGSRVWTGEL